MDLASGYSDSINYGNGYTPLANNAINNNNAEYQRNQLAMAMMAQAYNPYANSGGSFGAQPAYYAGQGAAYTGATGGNIFGGGNNDPFGSAPGGVNGNPSGGATAESAALMLQDPAAYYRKYGVGGSGGGDPGAGNLPGTAQQPIPSFWQGVRDMTGMGQPGGSGYDPYAGLGNQGQQGVTDPMGYGSGGYQGNAIPNQNRAPVQGGTTDPFWQGVRDMFGADPKDQSRVPNAFGTGAQPFNSYGVNTATPESAALMLQSPAAYYAKYGGGGFQNAGLSMQPLTENQFRNAPNALQAQDRAAGQQYSTAVRTSPAIDPQDWWGGHEVKFPVQQQYNPDPSPNFGNDQYPLITYEHDAPNLLDNNMLNRPQQQGWREGY